MKTLLTSRNTVAAFLLSGCWTSAQAQMLGSPTAQVLLGRPLHMTVPARFASNDSGEQCVHADVFYGESRVAAGQVRATVTGPLEQRRIRIESDSAIDEPVVTVSVRAGCRNTVTRNYILLPEYPSETLLAQLESRNALLGRPGATPLKPDAAATPAVAATSPRRPQSRPMVMARAAGATPPPARVRTAAGGPRQPQVAAPGPRLRVEPLAFEPQAMLRVSASLADPVGDASRRATAALLWQAINADPADLVRTGAMLQKLEQDLAQLRQNATQTRSEMAALRARLDEPQPWYLSTVLVHVLALLLLSAASAAGVLWYRTRRMGALPDLWYLPPAEGVAPQPAAARAEPDVEVKGDEAEATALPQARSMPAVVATPREVDLPLAPAVAATAADVEEEEVDFELPAFAAAPRRAGDGLLRVETLAATFEEVEFLASLGLGADAMDVLKAYLQDSSNPAPLAFLELMRLCEQAGDPLALATVRRRYFHAYGVEAPRLQQALVATGVEVMDDLSARIVRAWGSNEALEVIEQALFVVPTPGAPITLQAGRDLLCLYDLALALLGDAAMPAAGTAEGHALAPWAHTDDAQSAAQAIAEAQGDDGTSLDVDLTAAAPLVASDDKPPLEFTLDDDTAAAGREAAARATAARRAQEDEDAFSAAVASERVPVSRY